ncbi:nucleolin [Hordeum vulgare]|nr:nucleolin [Hordeum vulgare]
MVRGYSINMLHYIDTHTRIKVMDLIVETVRRTTADEKISCGYAPYIHLIDNVKIRKHAYPLDHQTTPLQPEFENNEVVLDPKNPSSATIREQTEIVAEQRQPK